MAVVQSKEAVSQTSSSTCSAQVQLLVLYLSITSSSPSTKQRAARTQAVHRAAPSCKMAISTLLSHPGLRLSQAATKPHSQCLVGKQSCNTEQALLAMTAQQQFHSLPASRQTPIIYSLQVLTLSSRPKDPAQSALQTSWRFYTSLDRPLILETCLSVSAECRISLRHSLSFKSPVQALG